MVDIDLGDLVDRLRDVAGGVTTVKQQAVQRVSEGTLLVLQQCLRRHPVVSLLLTSQSERQRECLTMLRASQETEPQALGSNDILDTLAWVNATASELEVERLSGVFQDGEKAHAWCREQLVKQLGVVDTPLFTQNRESYVCPWNVLFTQLCGPLRDVPRASLPRGDLDIPNATTAMLSALREIRVEWTNSVAWCNLLKELNAFPIGNVRAVWQCALYIFPTSAALVQQYVKREVEELAEKRALRQCHEEDEAKSIFTAHLRILNTFGRHIELCYSCKLYELFFDYMFDFIEPDNSTHTDKLFRACLFRDVGFLPYSTPLWTRYLAWKGMYIRDERKRVEWRRSLFRRILQMPLLGTDKIKEEYEAFVSYELSGRVAPAEKIEMEKTYTRAKMEAEEINQVLLVLAPEERLTPSVAGAAPVPAYKTVGVTAPSAVGYFGVPPVLTPQLVAAYEPPSGVETEAGIGASLPPSPRTSSQDTVEDAEDRLDHARRMVSATTRLWGVWESLLRMVRLSSLGGGTQRRERIRVYLAMRACFFVRKESSWRELIDYIADDAGAAYTEKERLTLAEDVLHLHGKLGLGGIFFSLYTADLFYHQFERRGAAFRLLQRAAQDELHWLLDFIRTGNQPDALSADALREQEASHDNCAASTHLQNLCVIGVNWMRMIARQQDRFHTLLVSRYMMHQIDFLSLTMSVIKLLLKKGAISSPEIHLRPFNVFCGEWLKLEIVRNQNYDGAEQLLWQWKEHLRMLLRSAKSKDWSTEMCGTDETFLHACASLMIADPSRIPNVMQCAGELADVAREDELRGCFVTQYEALRHRVFHCPTPISKLPHTFLSGVASPPAARVPATHYDTQLFRTAPGEPLPAGWDGLADEAARSSLGLCFTAPVAALAAGPPSALPEESLWANAPASSSSFRGGDHGRGTFGDAQRHFSSSRFENANKSADPSGGGGAQRLASKRTLVCSSATLSTEGFPLLPTRAARPGRSQGGGADALASQRSRDTPTDAVANLLTHLPTRYQYLPADKDLSTEWLLRFLSSTEGLRWTEGMERPATPSTDNEAEEGEEEDEEMMYDECDAEQYEEADEEDEEFEEALEAAFAEEMGDQSAPEATDTAEAVEEEERSSE